MISHYLSTQEWKKILPRVYLVGTASLTWKAKVLAAVLWAGPGAVAAGRTAAALHGLVNGRTDQIEIAVPRRLNSAHGVKVRRDPSLRTEPRVFVDSIPVTRISKTILDLCGGLSLGPAGDLVADAVRRGKTTIVDLGRILDEAGGQGIKGTRVLRRILTERFALGVTDSEAEDLFIALARRRGYSFTHHYVVKDDSYIAELDFADVLIYLDVEVDGGRYHDDPEHQQLDKNRDAELAERGWTVLRFTYWDLVRKPDWVFEKIDSVRSRLTAKQLSMDEYEIRIQR